MKKLLLSATAVVFALAASAALAADLPSRKEAPVYAPPPPPPPMWTGFYGGLNIGGGWSANSNNVSTFVRYNHGYYRHGYGRYGYAPDCRTLRQACLKKGELGETGEGNCARYRRLCR